MFLRLLLSSLLVLFLFGCESKPPEKARLKKEPPPGDLLSDVSKEPTYGHQALRTLKGAHEVQQDIKKQQKEREEIKQEAD
jgi:hypothetical protein